MRILVTGFKLATHVEGGPSVDFAHVELVKLGWNV